MSELLSTSLKLHNHQETEKKTQRISACANSLNDLALESVTLAAAELTEMSSEYFRKLSNAYCRLYFRRQRNCGSIWEKSTENGASISETVTSLSQARQACICIQANYRRSHIKAKNTNKCIKPAFKAQVSASRWASLFKHVPSQQLITPTGIFEYLRTKEL